MYQDCPTIQFWYTFSSRIVTTRIIFLLLAEWRRKLSTLPLIFISSGTSRYITTNYVTNGTIYPAGKKFSDNSGTSKYWLNQQFWYTYNTRIVLTILVRSRIVCREQFGYILELQNYLNNSGTYQNWGRKVQHDQKKSTVFQTLQKNRQKVFFSKGFSRNNRKNSTIHTCTIVKTELFFFYLFAFHTCTIVWNDTVQSVARTTKKASPCKWWQTKVLIHTRLSYKGHS